MVTSKIPLNQTGVSAAYLFSHPTNWHPHTGQVKGMAGICLPAAAATLQRIRCTQGITKLKSLPLLRFS